MSDELRQIEMEMEISADAAKLWRALSTAEGLSSW
jgi:uncharacterized protein YndB with AHSA1/START domain